MEITNVRFRKVFGEGKLAALVSVVIDNTLAVHDIKVIRGSERLFIAMPSRKDDHGVFRDIVHPISQDFRTMLESEILNKYETECVNIAVEA